MPVQNVGLVGAGFTPPPQAPPTGLIGAELAQRGGLQGALAGLTQGIGQGRTDVQPFAQAGRGAIDLQAALSGAGGIPAQQQAFAQFQESPGQQFLRDRAEQALLRNQAAIGGLGGGNVRSALQEQAIGLAQQDFGNQFARLGQVSGQGLQAAGLQAGLAGQGGQTAADLAFRTGQSLAGGRTRAGEQIAGRVGETTSALANLISQQGAGVSDVLGGATGNLANLLAGAGAGQAASQTELARLLANIAAMQGSQAGGLPGIPRVTATESGLTGLGQLASGIGTAATAFGFSDVRMKENIVKIGEGWGVNFYKWDWKQSVIDLVKSAPSFGVIAQEVQNILPDAISTHESGFLMVDYGRLQDANTK